MYHLLVVDDEPVIADDLVHLFSELTNPRLAVHKGYTAEEAYAILWRHPIDVMVLDIAMPGTDGLSVLSSVRDNWPACRVVMLSGYDNFNYAQQALHLHAFDYLLKSQGDEKLVAAVKRALSHRKRDEAKRDPVTDNGKAGECQSSVLEVEYLRRLVHGEGCATSLVSTLQQAGLSLRIQEPILLIGVRTYESETVGGKNHAAGTLESVMARHLRGLAHCACLACAGGCSIWFVQPKGRWPGMLERLPPVLAAAHRELRVAGLRSTTIVRQSRPCDWRQVCRAFRAVDSALSDDRPRAAVSSIGFEDSAPSAAQLASCEARVHMVSIQTSLLLWHLERGEGEEFRRCYSRLKELVHECALVSQPLLEEVCSSLQSAVVRACNRWSLLRESRPESSLARPIVFDGRTTLVQFLGHLDELAEMLAQYSGTEKDLPGNRAISAVHRYIHSHLDGDLSLTRLAEMVQLHPAYLSRLHTQVTSVSLSSYIAECRIVRAAELITQRRLRVEEIATAVGFWTPTYFSRFFKAHTGLTPTEYRMLGG